MQHSLAGTAVADDTTTVFYYEAIRALQKAQVPVLVGGSYALFHFTGIARQTKDLDLCVRRQDIDRTLEVMRSIGAKAEITFGHWLGKAFRDDALLDILYCSGNGIAEIDDLTFARAPSARVLGITVPLCPPEDMIWSKAFILERERYDGADIAHLILALGPELDWRFLLERFGRHWRMLFVHLVLFGFVYPSERSRIPAWVMREMQARLAKEIQAPDSEDPTTLGTLISRAQYLPDLAGGFLDGRRHPENYMTADDIKMWTDAIADEVKPHGRIEGHAPDRGGR